jgi:hypothetical protein
VIKTVPFDIPLSFIIGMLVPLACPLGVRSVKSIAMNRYLLGTVLFVLFFFVPLGAYLYYYYPDWSLMYFIDPSAYQENTIIIIGALALVSYMAAAKAGFFISAKLIRGGNRKTVYLILGLVLLALAIFSALSFNQLMSVGTYAEYTANTTVPLYSHLIGWVINIDGLAAGVILILTLKTLRSFETQIS